MFGELYKNSFITIDLVEAFFTGQINT